VNNPFFEAALALAPAGMLDLEHRAFAGFYREALETNSQIYRFFCLFKIAEGILKRRERAATAGIERGDKPTRREPVRIPKDRAEFPLWLNGIYPRRAWDDLTIESVFIAPTLGRTINDLVGRELTDLRNDVAHALSDTTGTVALSVDEALHLARVETWLPLLRCIVRRLMKDEFPTAFLSHLAEDGTIKS
jgi:methylamine utilization protein MauJ